MRIVSVDGMRSFPYDDCALIVRTIMLDSDTLTCKYSINCIYCGKEYELAYYSNENIAYELMQEVLHMPMFEEGIDEDDEPYYDEIRYIRFPSEEEFKEEC